MALLELIDITKVFEGLIAVNKANFSLYEGEILGLIGPNGAGKTTLFNIISGTIRCSSGDILFNNQNLNEKQSYEVSRLGISRTFQNSRLFNNLTVEENVFIGGLNSFKTNIYDGILGLKAAKRESDELKEKVKTVLERLKIDDLAKKKVFNLPYGSQRLVEIARATIMDH